MPGMRRAGFLFQQCRFRPSQAAGALHGEPLFGGSAGQRTVRLTGERPGKYGSRLQGGCLTMARPRSAMVGGKIGGVNVFGGGLPLFATGEKMVGPAGVSGDTSCAYHMIAWRVR